MCWPCKAKDPYLNQRWQDLRRYMAAQDRNDFNAIALYRIILVFKMYSIYFVGQRNK